MSNNALNAKDSISHGCTNPSDITAETCGDKRYLHTTDNKATALLCGILETLQSGDGPTDKVADVVLSATNVVRATSPTNVTLASPDTIVNATVLGLATSATAIGGTTPVVTYGEFEDGSFNFPLNAPLFLSPTGMVTDIPPTTGVLTQLGYSLGTGKIFLNIQDPICL